MSKMDVGNCKQIYDAFNRSEFRISPTRGGGDEVCLGRVEGISRGGGGAEGAVPGYVR